MPNPFYTCSRWKYSLTVRLVVLLFMVNTIASACSSDQAKEEQDTLSRERSTALEPDTASVKRNTPATTVGFLGNPFIASRSKGNFLSSYYDRINSDFTVDADPIENLHRTSVTDTVFTIRFGASVLEFYAPTQTGDLLLQVADIRNSDIALRNNIRVGMTQPELMSKLKAFGRDIRLTNTQSEVIASTQDGAPVTLRFFLKGGKVSRILYEGYVD